MLQPFLLELDGVPAGRVLESHGGALATNEIKSPPVLIRRTLPNPAEFTNIVLACGPGMSRLFYDWVGSTFLKLSNPKNGAVITLGPNSKPTGRLEFSNAWVTSLIVPELNKSENKQAALIISLKPTRTSFNKSVRAQSLGSYRSPLSRPWHTCDFQIKIAGLETDCSHVTRIERLNLGQKIIMDVVGGSREGTLEPTKIEFSDVTLEIPESHAGGFQKWLNDSVTEGRVLEKDGSLDLLAPQSASPYFTVKLEGMAIRTIGAKNASVRVSMFCESMTFSAGTAAIA